MCVLSSCKIQIAQTISPVSLQMSTFQLSWIKHKYISFRWSIMFLGEKLKKNHKPKVRSGKHILRTWFTFRLLSWLYSIILCYIPASSQVSDQSDQGLSNSHEETPESCPGCFYYTSESFHIWRVILSLTSPAVLWKDNLIRKGRQIKVIRFKRGWISRLTLLLLKWGWRRGRKDCL